MNDRVEMQHEIDADREGVFGLVSTGAGLRLWLDDGEIEPRVGGEVRLRLRDSDAVGKVLAIDPPQHISFTWQWVDEGRASGVVAFDAIDHGSRTHLTVSPRGLARCRAGAVVRRTLALLARAVDRGREGAAG